MGDKSQDDFRFLTFANLKEWSHLPLGWERLVVEQVFLFCFVLVGGSISCFNFGGGADTELSF